MPQTERIRAEFRDRPKCVIGELVRAKETAEKWGSRDVACIDRSRDIFEVSSTIENRNEKKMINFREGTCECTRFRQRRIPCVHMFAVMRRDKRDFLDLPESLICSWRLMLHSDAATPLTRSNESSREHSPDLPESAPRRRFTIAGIEHIEGDPIKIKLKLSASVPPAILMPVEPEPVFPEPSLPAAESESVLVDPKPKRSKERESRVKLREVQDALRNLQKQLFAIEQQSAIVLAEFPDVDGLKVLLPKEQKPSSIRLLRDKNASNNTLKRVSKSRASQRNTALANISRNKRKLDDVDPTRTRTESRERKRRRVSAIEEYRKQFESVKGRKPKK